MEISPTIFAAIAILALLCEYMDASIGMGYGPLITGGQIISGREIRNSVGSTTLAEAMVCIVGFLGYVLVEGNIFWKLAMATSVGSIVAAPFAAITVRRVNTEKLRLIIGLATIILGAYTLVNTFIL